MRARDGDHLAITEQGRHTFHPRQHALAGTSRSNERRVIRRYSNGCHDLDDVFDVRRGIPVEHRRSSRGQVSGAMVGSKITRGDIVPKLGAEHRDACRVGWNASVSRSARRSRTLVRPVPRRFSVDVRSSQI